MSLIKNTIFYIALFFIYLFVIEFFSRTIIFYTTKNQSIYLFGVKKDVKFEIVDLSNFQFNVTEAKKNHNKENHTSKDEVDSTKTNEITAWIFGASLSHGYSCGKKSSSWPNELANINNKINIVNFSFPGVHSDYSIKKLKYGLSENLLKKPNMIIWAHRDEEVLSIYKGIERNNDKIKDKYQTKKINPTSYFLIRANKTAESKLTFFKIMNYAFHKINHTSYKARDKIKPTKDDYMIAIENYKWNTVDAINAAEDNNISRFIILSLFSAEQVKSQSPNPVFLDEYFKTAISLKNDHKINFLSTTRYLSNTDKKNIDNYFCENNHFNLAGNELISKIVNNFILQN